MLSVRLRITNAALPSSRADPSSTRATAGLTTTLTPLAYNHASRTDPNLIRPHPAPKPMANTTPAAAGRLRCKMDVQDRIATSDPSAGSAANGAVNVASTFVGKSSSGSSLWSGNHGHASPATSTAKYVLKSVPPPPRPKISTFNPPRNLGSSDGSNSIAKALDSAGSTRIGPLRLLTARAGSSQPARRLGERRLD